MYMIFILACLVVILFIALLLALIQEMTSKNIFNMTRYRIVKGYNDKGKPVYKLQESLLWILWCDVDEYSVGVYSVEDVKRKLEVLKKKNKKEEVIYKE